MDRSHDPACDGNHTARQRCETGPTQTQSSPPRTEPLTANHRNTALAVELTPGLLFLVIYVVAAKSWLDADDVLWLAPLTIFSGGGWFIAGRLGTGCVVSLLRFALGIALAFLLIEAFSNDSSCYRDADDLGACYARAIRQYDVGLTTYILFPFASTLALLLTIRRSPWGRMSLRSVSLQLALRTIAGSVTGGIIVVGVPLFVGLLYSRTDYGRPTLLVENATEYDLYVFYRPGHGRGDELAVGETKRLRPQFDRFDDPREVHFVVIDDQGISTYWGCQWDFAKEQEPIVVDFRNSSGCQMHTVDPSQFSQR